MVPFLKRGVDANSPRGRGALPVFGSVTVFVAALLVIPALSTGGGTARADLTTTGVGNWVVDKDQSTIAFSGTHAGNAFNGVFTAWEAEISFDATALNASSAAVRLDAASAETGNGYNDNTLKQSGWLAPNDHPEITFTVSRFEQGEAPNAFMAIGEASVRGITRPLSFPFTLEVTGDTAVMNASFTIQRLDFEVGALADPKAEWVSNDINIAVNVTASRAAN